jgi:hypothetical protein
MLRKQLLRLLTCQYLPVLPLVYVKQLKVSQKLEELPDVERLQAVEQALEVAAFPDKLLLFRVEGEDLFQSLFHLGELLLPLLFKPGFLACLLAGWLDRL